MNDDLKELEILTAAWKTETPSVPGGLVRIVRRQGMWIRIHTGLGLATAALFFGGSLWAAVHVGSVEFLALAIGVWMLTLSTVIFQLQNRVSTWTPESHSTEEFIRLSLRRCQSSLRGVRFGFWLLLVEVLLLALWHAWYWSSRVERPAVAIWLFAATTPLVFFVGLFLLGSKRLKELARLEQIERQLSD
jgi:hypothetical protein